MKALPRIALIASPLLYAVINLVLLLGLRREVLQELGYMVPFYYNKTFISEVLADGLMGWLNLPSMWLCSLMVKPVAGALAVTMVGLLVGLAAFWAKGCKWYFAPLSWALPLVVLIMLNLGYGIYTNKMLGSEFMVFFIMLPAFLVVGLLVRIIQKVRCIRKEEPNPWIMMGIGVVTMGAFAFLSFTNNTSDENFRDILKMKHAVDRGEWQKVLDVMEEKDVDRAPTRIQVTYTRLALMKLGRAGDETFSYPDGDAPYEAEKPNQYLRLIAGPQLYYHYGKVNFAYRWCMEDMVEYGMRPHYVAYMLRCARMNGEEKLVAKYKKLLSEHPMAKMCKDEYPFTVIDEEEDKSVKQMMNYGNVLDGDGGHVEAYLLQSFATMRGGTREMTRTALDCCLVLKDIPDFWAHFGRMVPVWMNEEGGRIPRHYQEAALMFSALQGTPDVSTLPFNPELRARFEQLVQQSTANSQYGDDYNAQALKPAFGNTYWYYYFFTKDLKTN